MKHKWHDEIVAWAGGAEIEVCKAGVWYRTNYPDFNNTELKFHIKPQPKEPKYLYVYSINNEIELDLMPNLNYNYIGKIEVQND